MVVPPSAPDFCTEVGPLCPVEGTLYGYYPSLGANAFFAAFFGLCCILHLGLGIRYKTWTYMIALFFGCLGETIGYVGRVLLNDNPYSDAGFKTQITCLIISPAFIAAGIYLTLKHIVLQFGTEWSRLRPSLYTWIFILCDIFSLVLQGAGGGLASAGDPGSSVLDIGTDMMIAGVIFQVVVLVVFATVVADYFIRTKHRRNQLSAESLDLAASRRFRLFIGAILVAYIGILTRCAYRIPELVNGWRSEIMRNEPEFIVLEGVMIVISVLALTVFHPGFCFPALGNTIGKKAAANREKRTPEDSMEPSIV